MNCPALSGYPAEVAENPDTTDAKLKLWLEELRHVTEALAALNQRCATNPADGVYTRVIKALGHDFNRLSIRSRALLLQFHCAYPDVQSSGWEDPYVSVPSIDDSVSQHINNAITALEQQYTLDWERTGSTALAQLFTDTIQKLRGRLARLEHIEKKIALLDLIKWFELAVWVGNPKGAFRDRWHYVFVDPKATTVQRAAQVFWNDLIRGYRNNYLVSLLSLQSPRGLEFVLKEVELLRNQHNNLHGVSRDAIQLEHILPQHPSFDVQDVGFQSQDEYDNALHSLANLIFMDEALNRTGAVGNNPPYLKAHAYITQKLHNSSTPVKHIMGELPPLGRALEAIYTATGDKSSLYRAYLRLRQIDLTLFVAESL